MDQPTLDAIQEAVRSGVSSSAPFGIATLLASIVVPILTGGVLALLGYLLDRKRNTHLKQLEASAKLLEQRLERQGTIYEKLLSLSSENRKQSMQKTIDLYAQMQELRWSIVDQAPGIDAIFQRVRRAFYQNALFLSVALQNSMFITMIHISSVIQHQKGTSGLLEKASRMEEQLKKLGQEISAEFDLIGTKLEYEDIGKIE